MNRIITILLCITFAVAAYAQQLTVTGLVSSENDGEALPGVTVRVKGKSALTATDIDGKFSIRADKGDQLEFSYIGYKTLTAKVSGEKTMNIVMSEDQTDLDEVVVVGYATVKKITLTGAASGVRVSPVRMHPTSLSEA